MQPEGRRGREFRREIRELATACRKSRRRRRLAACAEPGGSYEGACDRAAGGFMAKKRAARPQECRRRRLHPPTKEAPGLRPEALDAPQRARPGSRTAGRHREAPGRFGGRTSAGGCRRQPRRGLDRRSLSTWGEADSFTVRRGSDAAGRSRLRPRRSRPALPDAGQQRATPMPGTGGRRRASGRTRRPVSRTPPRRRRGTGCRRAPAPMHALGGGHCPRSGLRSLRARASTAPPRARCTDPVDDHPRVGS